jgi:GT2 family glycosyltransferase
MSDLISIVTLTHNKVDVTRRCLPTLLRSHHRPLELIVVDNGSNDGTREWLQEFAADATAADVELRVVLNEGNIGCSTARNQGAAAARGKNLVYVDNDVALRNRNWLAILAAELVDDIAIVGPRIVYPIEPYRIQCAGVGISRTGRVQFRGRGEPRNDPRFDTARDVQCLISACWMMKGDVLRDVGGFDEAFNPVEYEDFDLCYRIRSAGHRIRYQPAAEMYHFESVTTGGTPSLPNRYLIIKHGLLFKERWKHMFEQEDGPPDATTRWKKIPAVSIDAVADLPDIE